jgi:multidrug efflux pump subunit AcrA (membrane-fusion protein)
MERSVLLRQLRLDRDTTRATGSRARRLALAAGVVLALAGLAWFGATWRQPPAVRTVVAHAAGEPGAGSVLDASGYVTARRQATVSAKITGKIVDVLIEEA